MAEGCTLTLDNGYPTQAGAPSTPTGGSWGAATYSFLITAGYESGLTYLDSLGYILTAVSQWNGVVVAANDKVDFAWAHANPQPIRYDIWYQTAATFSLGAVCTHAGTCAGTLNSLSMSAPDASSTATLPAAYPVITLSKVRIPPVPRELLERGYNGVVVQRSDALGTMFDRLPFNLSGMSCSASDYRRLLRWGRLNVRVKWDDQDAANVELASAKGRLTIATSLNSDHKQTGYPSLALLVDQETYTAP